MEVGNVKRIPFWFQVRSFCFFCDEACVQGNGLECVTDGDSTIWLNCNPFGPISIGIFISFMGWHPFVFFKNLAHFDNDNSGGNVWDTVVSNLRNGGFWVLPGSTSLGTYQYFYCGRLAIV